MDEITNEEILQLMKERGLTIEKVIDTIISANGVIGVGLITLGQTLFIYTVANNQLRNRHLTKEEKDKIIEDTIKKLF